MEGKTYTEAGYEVISLEFNLHDCIVFSSTRMNENIFSFQD